MPHDSSIRSISPRIHITIRVKVPVLHSILDISFNTDLELLKKDRERRGMVRIDSNFSPQSL